MVWSNLVRGRFKESLQVGEKDVAERVKEAGEPPTPKPSNTGCSRSS